MLLVQRIAWPRQVRAGRSALQRINGAYLYEFGKTMSALAEMPEADCKRIDIYWDLLAPREAVTGIVYQSVFTEGWRVVYVSAGKLIEEIAKHLIDFENPESFEQTVYGWNIGVIKNQFKEFEAIIKAELQSVDLYYVSSVGGFDNKKLIDTGWNIFPDSVAEKAPEAISDIATGARCMAFELWTSMAFHFHRANEAVLRRYFDEVRGSVSRPKIRTMSSMLSAMEKHSLGDENIRSNLKGITVFHRNPIAHPDHHITTKDEAVSLYAAIRAAIGYMLDKLPSATMQEQIEATTDNPDPVTEQIA